MTEDEKCLCKHWFPHIEDRERCSLHKSMARPEGNDYWNGGNCTWQSDPVWPFQKKDAIVQAACEAESDRARLEQIREIEYEIEVLQETRDQDEEDTSIRRAAIRAYDRILARETEALEALKKGMK